MQPAGTAGRVDPVGAGRERLDEPEAARALDVPGLEPVAQQRIGVRELAPQAFAVAGIDADERPRRAPRSAASGRSRTPSPPPATITAFTGGETTRMESLLAFAAAVITLRAQRSARRPLARPARAGARRLVGRALRLRRRLGRAGLGRRGRLESSRFPRLLPVRRPLDGAAAGRRVTAAERQALGCSARARVRGLAIGIALAMPLHGTFSGTEIPETAAHLDFFPARLVAILGNALGTAGRDRDRAGEHPPPVRWGTRSILAGVAVAATGSALFGVGVASTSASLALAAGSSTPVSPRPEAGREPPGGRAARRPGLARPEERGQVSSKSPTAPPWASTPSRRS